MVFFNSYLTTVNKSKWNLDVPTYDHRREIIIVPKFLFPRSTSLYYYFPYIFTRNLDTVKPSL